jgi:hypothetical protein
MRTTLAFLLFAAGVPARAAAEAPIAGAAGYCAHVKGVARSESATLVAPELFARVGTVSAGEALGPTGADMRVTAGLSYSLSQLRRGLGLRGRADAECRREEARARLLAALERGRELGMEPALAARARVLEPALPEGERIVERVRVLVRTEGSTLEELDAARLRLDELRATAARTDAERQRLLVGGPIDPTPLLALVAAYRAADAEVEAQGARVRGSSAWDLRAQGGLDQVFPRAGGSPVFAALTLTYDLGHLSQRRGDADALEGRRRASREDHEGLERRALALLAELRATLAGDRRRLAELRTLEVDLAAQLQTVDTLQTSFVRRYRNHLWFERTRLEVERAFLEARIEALDKLVGTQGA